MHCHTMISIPMLKIRLVEFFSYALEQNFVGFDNTGFTPPDPSGAAGPDHYVSCGKTRV